jgi:hypothetical protein
MINTERNRALLTDLESAEKQTSAASTTETPIAGSQSKIRNMSQRGFIKGDSLMSYWKKFLNDDPAVRWAEVWLFVVLEYWMEKNGVQE